MKNIYVIFSSTDLRIGRMIRFVTKNEYNHCSVCVDEDMSKFYSFSRLYRSNPLIAGFTVESPFRYTLSSRTRVKVISVPVSEKSYGAVIGVIEMMSRSPENYVYNFISAAVYLFGRRFDRSNAFTCAEFTNDLMKTAGISMPNRANIRQMETALSEYPTWEGRAVDGFAEETWGDDRYLDRIGKRRSAVQIALRFKKMLVGHA